MSEAVVKFHIPEHFKPILHNTKRWEILKGGAGSGKSHNTAQKVLKRCITEPEHRYLVTRKVGRTLRESVFELLKQIISDSNVPSSIVKINKTDMTITFTHNNSKILFFGLDDPEKMKSIANITSIWCEEATEFTENDIDQLNLRLRPNTDHTPQITLTLNPVSATHWIKKRFFDNKDDDYFIHTSTYLDNPYINPDFKIAIEKIKQTNPLYYKIYGLGEWGTLEGLIYDSYEVVDELPKYAEIESLGLDFGYNHPQSLVHIKIDGTNAYIDEVYYQSGHDNGYMLEWMKQNAQELFGIQCWADAARPDLIEECQKAGMRIDKAKKDVFAGINTVKGLKLHFTRRSVNIIKEIQAYSWKKDKDGNSLDEPIKHGDDGMDAMRYGIFTELSRAGTGATHSFTIKGL